MKKDHYSFQLLLSGIAISSALLWLFFGQSAIYWLVPAESAYNFYIFFSGSIFSLGLLGIYSFIHSLLYFTDFLKPKISATERINKIILKHRNDALFYKSANGQYLYLSKNARRILKLGNKDALQHNDQQLHDSLLAHKIQMEDKRIIENAETIQWETQVNCNEKKQYYLCEKTPALNSHGDVIGINGYCKNITSEQLLRQKIHQLEDRYQQLFNRLPYPVVILDIASMLPFSFNESICKLLQYSAKEFSQTSFSTHVSNELQNKFKQLLINAHKNTENEFELKLYTKNKNIIDVSGFAQRVEIEGKNYLHILLQDITESKKSTNELIGSELKYRSLFEHANDAIIVLDIHTLYIIDANEIALSMLGYSRETLSHMTLFDLDSSGYTAQSREQLKNIEIYNHALYEHKICNRKGIELEVEINAHKLNYGHREVYQYVLRDIIQRKHTEEALRQSEHRYRQIFESNQAIKLLIDPRSNIIEDANPAAANFYGYTLDELKGMSIFKINVLPEDKLNILIQQTHEQNLGFYNCPHKLANGDIRFVEVRDGSIEIDDRTLLYSIVHDVTAGKQAEDKLILASKMFDYSTDAAIISDENNRILSVNQVFSEITGYQQSEVQGRDPASALGQEKGSLMTQAIKEQLDEQAHWQGKIWHRQQDGSTFPLNINIHIIKSSSGEIINHVILVSPQTSSSFDEDSSANHSPLTHLPNKYLYLERLNYALERNLRNDKKLAILMIDFKNFNQINQQYGYDIGDRILQSIAKRLKYSIRDSDSIAHLESDNFSLLIEDLVDIQQAGIVAQKIISTLSETYRLELHDISLDVSIGISISPDDGTDSNELLDSATQSLIDAQSQNGSVFQLTNRQLNQNAHTCLYTEENLLQALKRDEFENTYLPLVNTKEPGRVIAVETLLRWQHPEHNELLPNAFLPNAEKTGFISAIAQHSFKQAFKDFTQWQTEGLELNKLWMNISLSQINEELIDTLCKLCQEHQISHEKIALDFNEHKLLDCNESEIHILQQLRELGFYLCVDDFGSVGASLECLLQCLPSAIKIDRSFSHRSTQSIQTEKILQALSLLAHKLNVDIIAEGIETHEQYLKMREMHIDLMQGYYFSPALKATAITDYIKQTNG